VTGGPIADRPAESSRYDDELWELVPEERGPAPEHILEFVRALDPCEHALDLGCGDGRIAVELRCGEVTAADVSAVALERVRRRLTDASVVQLQPDAPLPLPDTRFDLVLSVNMLEHVRDIQLLLSEARRVLRPGGRLAITTPAHGRADALAILRRGFERRFNPLSPHIRFFTRRSLSALLGDLGFEVESMNRSRGDLLVVARR
jgi:SAM-dependent methyltransferase